MLVAACEVRSVTMQLRAPMSATSCDNSDSVVHAEQEVSCPWQSGVDGGDDPLRSQVCHIPADRVVLVLPLK